MVKSAMGGRVEYFPISLLPSTGDDDVPRSMGGSEAGGDGGGKSEFRVERHTPTMRDAGRSLDAPPRSL